jgi:hypothetical protein
MVANGWEWLGIAGNSCEWLGMAPNARIGFSPLFTHRISSATKEDYDNNNCLRNRRCSISVDTGKFVGRFRILRV